MMQEAVYRLNEAYFDPALYPTRRSPTTGYSKTANLLLSPYLT